MIGKVGVLFPGKRGVLVVFVFRTELGFAVGGGCNGSGFDLDFKGEIAERDVDSTVIGDMGVANFPLENAADDGHAADGQDIHGDNRGGLIVPALAGKFLNPLQRIKGGETGGFFRNPIFHPIMGFVSPNDQIFGRLFRGPARSVEGDALEGEHNVADGVASGLQWGRVHGGQLCPEERLSNFFAKIERNSPEDV